MYVIQCYMYSFIFIYFTFGEGNGNPLQYSCLENPMDGGAWWATAHGVMKSWTWLSGFTFTHWRRKWQPTPVFLPGESQGRGSLVGCRLWGCTELDTTEMTLQQSFYLLKYSWFVLLISAVQQSDSGIHMHILFHILFCYGLSLDIEYSSPCSVNRCLLFTHPIYNSLRLLIPNSHSMPPSPPS